MWVFFCSGQRRVIKIHSSQPLPTVYIGGALPGWALPAWVFRFDAARGPTRKRRAHVQEIDGLDGKITLVPAVP